MLQRPGANVPKLLPKVLTLVKGELPVSSHSRLKKGKIGVLHRKDPHRPPTRATGVSLLSPEDPSRVRRETDRNPRRPSFSRTESSFQLRSRVDWRREGGREGG